MKNGYTFLVLIFIASAAFGQGSQAKHKKNIEALIQQSFDNIWSELSSKNITTYYTNDFLLLEDGDVWNIDSIANYLEGAVRRNPKPIRTNTFDFIDIKIAKKSAWIAYHNRATYTLGGTIVGRRHWLESATATLTATGWKLEMLHSTRIKDD